MTPPPTPPRHLQGMPLPADVDAEYLQERYGRSRATVAAALVLALAVVPFLVWVVWAGLQQADQELRWTTVGFSETTDTSVQIRFDVFLPAGTTVTCVVRALDRSGVEVGRAEVPVAAEGSDVSVVYALPVTARPSSAFVETCRPGP